MVASFETAGSSVVRSSAVIAWREDVTSFVFDQAELEPSVLLSEVEFLCAFEAEPERFAALALSPPFWRLKPNCS